jgi:hypothetical protein
MDARSIYSHINEALAETVGQMTPEEEVGSLDPLVSAILGIAVPGEGGDRKVTGGVSSPLGETEISIGILIDNSASVSLSRLVKGFNAIEASIANLGKGIKKVIAFDVEDPPSKLSTPKFNVTRLKSFASSGKPGPVNLGPALDAMRGILAKVDIIFVLSDFDVSDGAVSDESSLKDLATSIKRIRRKAVFVNVGTRSAALARKLPMIRSLLVRL